ncbi:hypothetical protein GKZ90_0010330 [Flavobacterium sp. MC2016-06]|uniref:hypothetical protein n=1 Tax=Flavobacterium sp. MC2016-06 TaxID=2676308 RepID=UPI0012BB12A6|nr:hypothetical protein [Flavobacterium sp. MC2016-06]MBU3858496.1 hypothetical protein [Flavobacterium sp. MC2016-06]
MDKIFKLSANIYQFLLILIIPLFLIAKFLVGAAGHNSAITILDYALFAYAIIVLILLINLKKLNAANQLKNSIRIVLSVLILTSICYELYQLYAIYLLYKNHYFVEGDNISIGIILLIIALSTTLLAGLIKDKI